MGETLLKGYLQIKCANPGRIVRKVSEVTFRKEKKNRQDCEKGEPTFPQHHLAQLSIIYQSGSPTLTLGSPLLYLTQAWQDTNTNTQAWRNTNTNTQAWQNINANTQAWQNINANTQAWQNTNTNTQAWQNINTNTQAWRKRWLVVEFPTCDSDEVEIFSLLLIRNQLWHKEIGA